MKRIGVRLAYFVRTAWRGLRASPVTSAVAVMTIGISLVLVGAFALLLQNMESLLDKLGGELHVTAYLEDGLTQGQQQEIAHLIGTPPPNSVTISSLKSKSPEARKWYTIRGVHYLGGG